MEPAAQPAPSVSTEVAEVVHSVIPKHSGMSEELEDTIDENNAGTASAERLVTLAHDALHDASHVASHESLRESSHKPPARFHVSSFVDGASRLGNSIVRLTEGTVPGWLLWILIAQGVLVLLLLWFLMQQQRTINLAVRSLLRGS